MTRTSPDAFSLTAAVGLSTFVAAALLALWVLSWLLLRNERGLTWRWVALAATTGMLLTVGSGWLLTGAPGLADLLPGDWIGYHRRVAEVSDRLPARTDLGGWQDRAVFLYLMAFAHRALGSSALVTVVMNAALLGISAILLADLTLRLADERAAVGAAWLLATFPPFVLWSSLPHREAMALLLLIGSTWAGVRLASGPLGRPWEVAGLLGAAALIFLLARWTRDELLYVMAPLTAAGLGARLWRWPPAHRFLTRPIGWVASGAAVAGALLLVGYPLHRWLDAFVDRTQISRWNLYRLTDLPIGSEPQLEPVGPVDLVLQMPLALIRSLWGPPPGGVLLSQPMFVAEAALFWILTPLLIIGLVRAVRQRIYAVAVLLLPAVMWAILSGLTLNTWGILSRMRATSWALLLPLVAIGAVHAWDRRAMLRRWTWRAVDRAPTT